VEAVMLEELDAIDWHALTHAYGPADDVPDLLRALLSPEAKIREQAQWPLYGNVYHQGSVYPATQVVVSILLKLLADPATPDRPWIVGYLCSIALSYIDSRTYNPELFFGPPDEWYEWNRDAFAAHQAVRNGLPLFLELLDAPDHRLRLRVAQALGALREDAQVSSVALRGRLEQEQHQWARGAIHLALADLTVEPSDRQSLLSVAFTQEPTSGARLQVAMRLVEEEGAVVTDAPLAYLIAALPTLTAWSAQVTDEPHVPWLSDASTVDKTTDPHAPKAIFFEIAQLEAEGSLYPNLSDVASTLKRLPSERLHAALPYLLEAMITLERTRAPSFFVLEKVAKAFLHVAFGEGSPTEEQQRTAERLTYEQRQALEGIVGSDTLWQHQGNMRSLLTPLGLPTERETLRAFVTGKSA
jgi:hypothetical protein